MAEYKFLDTRALDKFINSQDDLKTRYQDIKTRYARIVQDLMENWKGQGAEAFMSDSETITTNITGIQDILTTMCDILRDCKSIFEECDTSLGNNNRSTLENNQ